MKNLVIVESPTKAKTISKFLGNGYEIKASMGHVMDLPKSKLGVDVDNNFDPMLEAIPEKENVIKELRSIAKEAESIILATDPDREGEAIASDIKDVLEQNSKGKNQKSKFRRIVFHEITKEAIEEALKNPGDINRNLVDAQTARRVLDRLVGYKLSPLLWKKVRRGLSAGRVQSIALRLIVEREKEIEKFKKEEYWTINVILSKAKDLGILRDSSAKPQNDNVSEFELVEINGEKIESQKVFNLYDGEYKVSLTSIQTEKQAQEIVEDLKTKQFMVTDVSKKETNRSPQAPFTTSTLQQDGARRFGFSGKRTMRVAQKLYEEGLITYHRTDSLNVSQSAISSMRSFIKKEYGEKYLPPSPRFYKTKQKLAQEAHEAIRPTKFGEVLSVKNEVLGIAGNDGWKIYELIWRRAIASQMSDAVIESTSVIVDSFENRGKTQNETQNNAEVSVVPRTVQRSSATNSYRLKTNGSILVFEGFLKVNPQALQDKKLPDFKAQEELLLKDALPIGHETMPPPRYNDASLVGTLEEKGIGRPSTYATIISVIEERRYVEKENGRFIPTTVGVAVNDFLVSNFSDIDDIDFTALMEDQLDLVAHGQREWRPMIREFYEPFSKKLEKTEDAKRVKIEVEKTDIPCSECGKGFLVVRIGRFGKFLSCSRFPDCKFTKPFVEETNLTCPKDGGKIIVKKTRKGKRFYGCSNYPNCDFAAWKLEDITNNSKSKVQSSKLKKDQKSTVNNQSEKSKTTKK